MTLDEAISCKTCYRLPTSDSGVINTWSNWDEPGMGPEDSDLEALASDQWVVTLPDGAEEISSYEEFVARAPNYDRDKIMRRPND